MHILPAPENAEDDNVGLTDNEGDAGLAAIADNAQPGPDLISYGPTCGEVVQFQARLNQAVDEASGDALTRCGQHVVEDLEEIGPCSVGEPNRVAPHFPAAFFTAVFMCASNPTRSSLADTVVPAGSAMTRS